MADEGKDKKKDEDGKDGKEIDEKELGKKVQTFIDWCIKTANDDSHLYVFGAHGPSNYDCTGFLSAGLQAAGFPISPCHGDAFDEGVLNCGFESIDYNDSQGTDPLKPGDILNNPNHVELYIGNGKVVGAHSAHKAPADQISVEGWFPDDWTNIYRCTKAAGVKNGDASSVNNPAMSKSGDNGFRVTPKGEEWVHIIKLPEKKTFAEPVYPDYVTVSDTVPKWVLDNTIEQINQSEAQAKGENFKDGDAKEKAPNGLHYSENDIKYLMENQKITREQAIETLSKAEKYTRKVKQNKDGTWSVDKDKEEKKES